MRIFDKNSGEKIGSYRIVQIEDGSITFGGADFPIVDGENIYFCNARGGFETPDQLQIWDKESLSAKVIKEFQGDEQGMVADDENLYIAASPHSLVFTKQGDMIAKLLSSYSIGVSNKHIFLGQAFFGEDEVLRGRIAVYDKETYTCLRWVECPGIPREIISDEVWLYAITDSDETGQTLLIWDFTGIAVLWIPCDPTPANDAFAVSIPVTLSVLASDPCGYTLTVTFYGTSDDSIIGTDTEVRSGSRAEVTWSGLTPNTIYSWYAKSCNMCYCATSATWSFTTVEEWVPWPWWLYDENDSGYIEIGELLDAISDYIGGDITISQLLELISLYINHTPKP